MSKVQTSAVGLYTDGFTPIRLKKGSKAPDGVGWQTPNYENEKDVRERFDKPGCGLGLLLGGLRDSSRSLVDVDLDSDIAIELAPLILGDANMIFIKDTQITHWMYVLEGPISTKKFLDVDGSMLLELRSDGLQTMIPPSVHPSGVELRWNKYNPRIEFSKDFVLEKVHQLGALTLLAKHWPDVPGSRQALTMAVTGFLLNNGYKGSYASFLVKQVLYAVNELTPERVSAITSTQKAHGEGKHVTGGPTIQSILGEEVYRRFVDYLDLPTPDTTEIEFDDEVQESTVASSLISIYDLVTSKVFTQTEIVEGLLWAGKTHWLYSDPNAGKTMLALALALHIAAGRPFAGREVRQGSVVIIEEDSSLAVVTSYLDNFASLYGMDFRDLPIFFNQEQGIRIYKDRDIDKVYDLVHSHGSSPSLVVWDSCERILPSSSFNSREIDPLDRLLKSLANEGTANLVLDHTNKSQYENPNNMDVLYGSRAKSAIADIMLQLQGSIKLGVLNGTFTKFRGETPPPIDIFYGEEFGFKIKDRISAGTKSPYEAEVIGWFLAKPRQWIDELQIEEALWTNPEDEISLKRLHRTLESMASRRLLRRMTDLEGIRFYKYNV